MKLVTATALMLAAGIGTAAAAPANYALDPAHLSVAFIVDHLGFSNMIGRFNTAGGQLVFDKGAVENSQVKVEVDTASIDTNFAKRDEHLRSPDFFNAKEFPKMTFSSTKLEKLGERTGRMTGNLTLLGVTKPVVLDVTFNKDGVSPASKQETVGFSARGKLKRTDFGMKYGAPNIGDEIQLLIEAEGVKQ